MKTIIYYTSNRENSAFEQKVIDGVNTVRGDVPVISVSQKPLDFGHNICVGDVGHTYFNAFRQLLIGAQAATTEWVVMAEADCFYPRTGYFDFAPADPETIYTYDNVWILWKKAGKDYFRRKEQTHASLIYHREYLIEILEKAFDGKPEWSRDRKGPHSAVSFYPAGQKWTSFTGDAIVNVKTGDSMNYGTRLMDVKPETELPFWGGAVQLKKEIFGE